MNRQITQARKSGFTLVELLTVVAIIGILAGILIPVVGGAKKAALKAQSKAQFNGWAQALEQYKSEYGYYPRVGGSDGLNDGNTLRLSSTTATNEFVKALSGRDVSGDRIGASSSDRTNLNPKIIGFYSFGDSEFMNEAGERTNQFHDAFGNPTIYIRVDHDGDGLIPARDFPSDSSVGGSDDFRGRVAIWTDQEDFPQGESVMSWE